MGLFGKKAEPIIAEPVIEKKEEPKPSFTPSNETIIGEGITMVGDFETKETLIINGKVEGNITSSTDIQISKTGRLEGNAVAENVYIDGSVDGDLEVKSLTKLSDTASVRGTLNTAKFVTSEGSNFDGQLKMKKAQAKVAEPEVVPEA